MDPLIVLSLLRTHWKQAVVVVAFMAVIVADRYHAALAEKYQELNTSLTVRADYLQRTVDAQGDELAKQSQAVQAMKDEADAKEKASRESIAKAAASAQVAKRDAANLMKQKPAVGEKTCEAARALFDREVSK